MDESIQPKLNERKIKLNLGCGNKIVKSDENYYWVNVDVVDPPKDMPLDIEAHYLIDDVTTLQKLPNDYADEIHAYHLIEHIPVYMVEDTLLNWFRVLKPGGVLICEQPDLVKACINYLQAVTTKDQYKVNNLGLFGLFGQPTPGNVHMEHKWGWIPESLGQLLSNCGFVDVISPPAQTHQGPQRDFRMEAKKPL